MILQILAILGLTFLIKDSYILSGLREKLISKHPLFMEFFGCSFCITFYSSIILMLFHPYWLIFPLACAFISLTISRLFDVFTK